MTENHEAELASFFSNLDQHAYSQPLAADTIGAGQIELNEMRRSNLLSDGWRKNGRVTYTGRGLLLAGVMMELAWLMRPREAAEHAMAFTSWFDECASNSDPSWWTRICHISSPVLSRNGDNNPRLVDVNKPDGDVFGRRIDFIHEADYRDRPLKSHATVVLPVGKLVKQWAIGAELRREKQTG